MTDADRAESAAENDVADRGAGQGGAGDPGTATGPRDLSREELGFERQSMVNWFGPIGLAITGMEALMSGIFGSYADKREVQGAFAVSQPFYDRSQADGDFTFDYVADVGDGFDSTYTVAWLLARESLRVGEHVLPRGRLLVMGGDQVYPTAKLAEYRNRLLGPYGAALPGLADDEAPEVFAIPGNHDWYDGLTTFLRLFCQSRPPLLGPRRIGGWRAAQERSYYALKLPHGWWLWGIDVQLTAEIDKPQLEYFLRVAERMRQEPGEPRLILATAQPSWVHSSADPKRFPRRTIPPSDEFSRLAHFEREVARRSGARLSVVLSGDLHHYCRYEQDADDAGDARPGSARQRITCGGGGAYLFPTHQMPRRLALAEDKDAPAVGYERRRAYPDEAASKRASWAVLGLPWGNFSFAALLGILYFLWAWLLESASLATATAGNPGPLSQRLAGWPGVGTVVTEVWGVLLVSPAASALALLVLAALTGYAFSAGRAHRPWLPLGGFVHGFAHLVLAAYLIVTFAFVNDSWLCLSWGKPLTICAFILEMMVVGGFLGALLFAVYLLLASRLSTAHSNEVFSAQRIADSKCFLRLVIRPGGALEIYPIGVDRVARAWRAVPDAAPGESHIAPDEDIETRLIEGPLLVE